MILEYQVLLEENAKLKKENKALLLKEGMRILPEVIQLKQQLSEKQSDLDFWKKQENELMEKLISSNEENKKLKAEVEELKAQIKDARNDSRVAIDELKERELELKNVNDVNAELLELKRGHVRQLKQKDALIAEAKPHMEYIWMNLSPCAENVDLFLKYKQWLDQTKDIK